jgi:hypothetical protein
LLLVLLWQQTSYGTDIMPITFIPYKSEYQEQIKILAALLSGERHPGEAAGPGASSPYPRLTGHYQGQPVEMVILQKSTPNGADPLNSDKFLLIRMRCPCSLGLNIEPKTWRFWFSQLLWWRRILTGKDALDANYAITSSDRKRAQRLLSHKKVKNLLDQLSPFQSLAVAEGQISLSYAVTSHQVFMARKVVDILRRMLRFGRLCENLA